MCLYSIFADLKAEIHFTPVPTSIHEGFIEEEAKIVCYTDHQTSSVIQVQDQAGL
jgi:transcription-repair coupling factor (superfamily II helicase)